MSDPSSPAASGPAAAPAFSPLADLRDRVDCVLFDLDDTLFEQITFLEGAFTAAAAVCGPQTASRVADAMLQITRELGSSSGRIFDEALQRTGLASDGELVKRMIRAFREHRPSRLSCFPGVIELLDQVTKRWPAGLITDGTVETQAAKVEALGIARYFSVIVYSDSLGGVATRKPSPLPYLRALEALQVRPERAVYIGDNPTKDFVGARALGLATVRVLTGEYRTRVAADGHDADYVVPHMSALLEHLR